ncbi:MAG: hypothetical protein AB9903_11070 [Vulcanimicrobiota bacterium]
MNSRLPFSDGKKNSPDITVLPKESTLKGRFKIVAPYLAEGTVVYKGLDGTRPVIIIEASISDRKSSALLEQLSFWAEQLGPSLTQEMLEQFEISGYRYLVMEYIEGKTLNALISPIKGVFLQEKILTEWAPSLYSLFSSLHDKNRESLYGNVIPWKCLARPDHIIRDREGRFRVILQTIPIIQASVLENHTDTAGFAPPELSEARECDARSLVYIAGSILYHLVTNGHDRSTGASSPRSINSRISPNLEKVLEKALVLNPSLRYQSIEELESCHIRKETSDSQRDRNITKDGSTPIVSQKGLVYHIDTPADHAAETDLKKMSAYVGIFIVAAICIILVLRGWLGALIAGEKSPAPTSIAMETRSQRNTSSTHRIPSEPAATGASETLPVDSSSPGAADEPLFAPPAFSEISDNTPRPTAQASSPELPTERPSAAAPALPGETYPRVATVRKKPDRPKETAAPSEHLRIAPVSGENSKYFLTPREQILAGLLQRKASDFREPEGRSTGNGTVITGFSVTSTSKEPVFEFTVPPGYYQMKSEKRNFYEFATVDKGSQDSSLRLLLVRPLPFPKKTTPEQAYGIYNASLEHKGATDIKMDQTYVGDKLAYGFSYNMTISLIDEPLSYSEIFFLSKDSNTVYIITESSPQSIFARYKPEFAAFINSFREY